MSNEELARRIQQGETALYQQLWEQVERFVSMQAGKSHRRMGDPLVDVDDLYNAGYIAMTEAVKTFDGPSFIHWLALYLRNAFAVVGGYRNKKSPLRFAVSLDAPVSHDDDTALVDTVAAPGDAHADTLDREYNAQLRAALDAQIDSIEGEDIRAAIRARYFEGKPFDKVLHKQGLRQLRHPSRARLLRPYLDEITIFYRPASVQRFRQTGMSSVEEIAMFRFRKIGLTVRPFAHF